MNINSMQRQSGHAAILFALMIPVLFGVFALGTDGARAVQDKARLLEAVEVASLAVAGQGSDNKVLAKSYLQYYFPLAKINDADITINKINCEDNPACQGQDRRFFEYQVSARISQPTWFPGNDAIIGFGADYKVYDGSVTRKYHSETVDVVLVADYSGSMAWPWNGDGTQVSANNPIRYSMMNDIMVQIAGELDKFNEYVQGGNKNRLAITGFDNFTQKRNPVNIQQMLHFDHLICNSSHACHTNCSYNNQNPKRLICVPWTARSGFDTSDVDEAATVNNIFNTNHWPHSTSILTTELASEYRPLSYFYDIELTDDFAGIKSEINSFVIRGSAISGTSSYAGIIRGAQMAQAGTNPRRLIIILSDGEDNFTNTTNKLISAGLCSTILNTLNSQNDVQARMVAVGFAYDINAYPQMKNCVGEENVFSAKNPEDIKNKILELITEEIGHLAPQR
ncbi:TadE/TadG family type IV pilus assembly protein [Vibrio metschnikovii]|uniref:TadE/TadG family type IV pilus assembly protein n=1 Tax=Vibrio metschnikovii TaxID=28172 RepID=UPI001C30641B|nr:TadE/TadG family type IV pilus assembly protein [Vibrio metschnikovii]